MTTERRYTVQYSSAHKLWFVFDRKTGSFVDHSSTRAGAERMAQRREDKEATQ